MSQQKLKKLFLKQNAQLKYIDALILEAQNLKQDLQELREKEEYFRQIAENVREVFFLMSAQTDEILYISSTYEKVWGRSCQSLYEEPQSWLSAIHPEDSLRAIATIETQFRTGEEFEEEYRIIRPDNSVRWVWVQAFPIRDERGEVTRFVAVAEDITKRKEAEEALKKAKNNFA